MANKAYGVYRGWVGQEITGVEIEGRAYSISEIAEALTARAAEKQGITAFATAILHGDDVHRKWLMDAAQAFIDGIPIPAAVSEKDNQL
jgi:hypothetical protein